MRKHHHLSYARVLAQDGFDFAQLDAKPADLDLIVNAPKILDVAVGTIAELDHRSYTVWLRVVTERIAMNFSAVRSGRLR